ncbi:selenium binding protein [Acetobacterium carbinolicum]|uniref:selenium binding protein n=1 Tax=Acetobacterium carbinolicum TaxID=52690 RepID=UPI0039BFFB67
MYENYTRQALPEKEYRALLGSALCVFNSNSAFIIENILNFDEKKQFDWYELMDRTSGNLKSSIMETITKVSNSKISILFFSLVNKRNRIIHSFQITDTDGKQKLATKDKSNKQYVITEQFLQEFIKENEELSGMLHSLRGF